MNVCVDTGVFYALHDADSNRHETAREAIRQVASGRFGRPHTSEYVYDEAVTLALARFDQSGPALKVRERIRGTADAPSPVELLFVGESVFRKADEIVETYQEHGLSFTDATTVALAEQHDIEHVLAFDDDFDGIVDRLDPTEVV